MYPSLYSTHIVVIYMVAASSYSV